jgi:signal peptidase I
LKNLKYISYFFFGLGLLDLFLSFQGVEMWSAYLRINLPEIFTKFSAYIELLIGYSLLYASKSKEHFKKFLSNLKALMWALLIAGVIRTFVIEPFKIPSGSMKPNLLVGDFLFVSKWTYGYSRYSFPFGLAPFSGIIMEKSPNRGDIIVFKLPGQENINYVKRLVGLPGETIKIIDGLIYIKKENSDNFEVIEQTEDGLFFDDQYQASISQLIESDYKILNLTDSGPLDYTPEYKIPKNKFFFMGDNRDNSSDSRVMSGVGFVPKENIIGKVWFIWFSINSNPLKIRYDRIFNTVK